METSSDNAQSNKKPWVEDMYQQITEVEHIIKANHPITKFIAKEIKANKMPENVARREVFHKEFLENMRLNVNNKEFLDSLGLCNNNLSENSLENFT